MMDKDENDRTQRVSDDHPSALLASRRHTVRFVLIVCAIAALGILQTHRTAPSTAVSHIPLYASLAILQLLFVWFVRLGVRAYGRSILDLLGKRWRSSLDVGRDFALAAALIAILLGFSKLVQHFLGPSSAKVAFLLPHGPLESVLWLGVAAIAGISEEIVYRGYLQPQLRALSGNLALAIGLQAIIFAIGHLYQGWKPAIITGIYGMAFGILAAWRKSIIPGMIAHSIIDIIGGLVRR